MKFEKVLGVRAVFTWMSVNVGRDFDTETRGHRDTACRALLKRLCLCVSVSLCSTPFPRTQTQTAIGVGCWGKDGSYPTPNTPLILSIHVNFPCRYSTTSKSIHCAATRCFSLASGSVTIIWRAYSPGVTSSPSWSLPPALMSPEPLSGCASKGSTFPS